MLTITSKQSAQLKQWKKLLTTKGRRKAEQYIIEGFHLVEEAINCKVDLKYVIVSEKQFSKHETFFKAIKTDLVLMAENCISELSQTETPQGVLAIVNLPKSDVLPNKVERALLVDAVQDPGNLGTMIRTADAAGFDAVILGEGTVDAYNEKVIRSTQGSLWHIPIIQMDLTQAITELKQQGVEVLATALHQNAVSYKEIKHKDCLAFIVGNEGSGVSQTLIEQADQSIFIEMPGKAESLNVAVASGILMFHFI